MPQRLRLLLPALLLAAAALAGCAGTKGARSAELPQWPLPPDKPRVKFVRSFTSEEDMEKGFGRKVLRVFIPADPHNNVSQPTGIALSLDERVLYVACASRSRILRANLEAGTLSLVGADDAIRPGAPFALAVDAGNNLYVSDMSGNAIFVYGPDGKFLRRFGSEFLERPTGIAIDRRRQLLYVVSGATRTSEHRIEVFSLAGQRLRSIGKRGPAPGEFNYPANLAVAKDGNLFVADMLNFRVQVFDPEGRLVSMFGSIGAGQPGTFDKAKSVAFDGFDNIYVVDSQQAYVQMFNPRFQPLMAFGGRLSLPGYMLSPNAIAIDSKNTIYVTDFFAGRVNVYQLVNTAPGDNAAPARSAPPAAGTQNASGQKPQGG
jgi:sugar lactone lactonase YvrE